MSVAEQMLATAQSAYQNALVYQSAQFGLSGSERRHINHDVETLRKQVVYWEGRVAAETARAAGKSSRGPIRFNL